MAPIALLSVSNKDGLLPLAKTLHEKHGFKLLSSGGTAKALEEYGLPVIRVADYTGSPEILDGRVKTLHPRIHGGILADKTNSKHVAELTEQNIEQIDLVVVNLYPFQETISNPKVKWEEAIEKIDIGGPTMVRAAAKNHSSVSILTKPAQYKLFLEALDQRLVDEKFRQQLALEAFEHTATYDLAISRWISSKIQPESTPWIEAIPHKQTLRYGENPHQSAVWYSHESAGWGGAKQIQGKELSTNNLLDLEAAISTLREFGYEVETSKQSSSKAAVVIKHTNPCGVAVHSSTKEALKRALDADRVSAFGGIVAINASVDKETANQLNNLFLECLVAPAFEEEALEVLSKKKNLRLLKLSPDSLKKAESNHIRSISGGFLVQELDNQSINQEEWQIATKRSPNKDEMRDLTFAWKHVKHVRSNAIVVATSEQSLGVGAGQMNRVGSAKLALEAAEGKASSLVLASDGFFPFDDTVRLAATYGVKAIIQPGGSIRDKDSISACDELGIAMVFTGRRHFLH